MWNNVIQGAGVWLVPIQNPSDATMITSRSPLQRGQIRQTLDASSLRGREIRLSAHVRTNVTGTENQGSCLLQIERPKSQFGFSDNRPVQSSSWKDVEILGRVDTDAERISIGCSLMGTGQMWVDDVQLQSRNQAGQWEPITIQNPGFEENDREKKPAGWVASGGGYVLQVTESNPFQGKRALSIKSVHIFGEFYPIGWSPDEKYVYLTDSTTGLKKIVMVRADGEEVKALAELPVSARSSIGAIAVTSDGQRFVYSVNDAQSDVWMVQNFDASR